MKLKAFVVRLLVFALGLLPLASALRAQSCTPIVYTKPANESLCVSGVIVLEITNLNIANPQIIWDNGVLGASNTISGVQLGPNQICFTITNLDEPACPPVQDCVILTGVAAPTAGVLTDEPTVCTNRQVTVSYIGTGTLTDDYLWDFAGGTIISGAGQGPYTVVYSSGGVKTISVEVNRGGSVAACAASTTAAFDLTVTDPAPAPVVVCGASTPSSVTFNWTSITGAAGYEVSIDGGQTFAAPTGTQTHTVDNLAGGQNVQLVVKALTPGVCDAPLSTPVTCASILCSTITINPLPAPHVCIGDSVTLTITPKINGAATNNIETIWNGANLGAQKTFTFAPTTAQTAVTVLVRDPNQSPLCPYATYTFNVTAYPKPTGSFALPNEICAGELITLQYDNLNIAPNSLFEWNLGASFYQYNNTLNSSVEAKWNTPGAYAVSLRVISNNCTTETVKNLTVKPKPMVDAGTNATICRGSSVQLNGQLVSGQGCTYEWLPTTGLSNHLTKNPIATPNITTKYYFQAICQGCASNIDSVTVIVTPKPVLTAENSVVQHCAGAGGSQLSVTAYGGAGGYQYSWFPATGLAPVNSPNPTANPNQTTTYKIIATDSNGCSTDTLKILVKVNPLPVANAGANYFLCEGTNAGVFLVGSEASGGFGSYSYHWTPSEGLNNPNLKTPYAKPDTTTIYQLTVTNLETGCTSAPNNLDSLSTAVVEVVSVPNARAYATDSVFICKGESVLLGDLAGWNGGPNYTYFWSPATGLNNPNFFQPTAKPTVTTTYKLTTLSDGCLSKGTYVTVVVKPAPTVAVERSATICPGESYQILAQVNGAEGPFAYEWSPAAGLSDPAALQPYASPTVTTTYTLKAYSGGCLGPVTETITIAVKPTPVIDANPLNEQIVLCPTEGGSQTVTLPASLSFNLQPYTFWWAPAAGLDDSLKLNPKARPTETTTYTLFARYGDCTVSDSVTVIAFPLLSLVTDGQKDVICAGETVSIRAYGNAGQARFVWKWIGPINGVSYTLDSPELIAAPSATTTYSLVLDDGICTDGRTLTVTVLPGAEPDFKHTAPTGCQGLTVSFTEQSTGDIAGYQWDFGDGTPVSNQKNPTHTYQTGGNYAVTLSVFTPDNCVYSKTVSLIDVSDPGTANFSINRPFNEIIYLPESVVRFTDESQKPVSWFWQFGDSATSTEQNPVHQYQQAGEFSPKLTIADANGCLSTITKGVIKFQLPKMSFPNVFTPNNDGVNDRWKPDYIGSERVTYKIFDRWGNLFYAGSNDDAGWNGQTPANAGAPAGVYFYVAQVGENRKYDGVVTLVR